MKRALCIFLTAVMIGIVISDVLDEWAKEQSGSREFRINNTESSDTLCTTEYSISELRDFTDKYSVTKNYFSRESKRELCTFSELNERFPIQCTRIQKKMYSVYKVKEGGKFFACWGYNSTKGDLVIKETFYINSLKTRSDFLYLKLGKSSYEDVCKIDPENELCITTSGMLSLSLLENGHVAKVYYSLAMTEEQMKEASNDRSVLKKYWTVDMIEIKEHGESCELFDLDNIFEVDLPK